MPELGQQHINHASQFPPDTGQPCVVCNGDILVPSKPLSPDACVRSTTGTVHTFQVNKPTEAYR